MSVKVLFRAYARYLWRLKNREIEEDFEQKKGQTPFSGQVPELSG
jgi:hypothetical protein